jgi:hypothetical protein
VQFGEAGTGGYTNDTLAWSDFPSVSSSEVSAGSSVTIQANSNFGGETVRVVYNNPDSDSSSTLGKFEVPN